MEAARKQDAPGSQPDDEDDEAGEDEDADDDYYTCGGSVTTGVGSGSRSSSVRM